MSPRLCQLAYWHPGTWVEQVWQPSEFRLSEYLTALRHQMSRRDPGGDRVPGLLGDLKLNRSLSSSLHHNRAGCDTTALDKVMNAQAYQSHPRNLPSMARLNNASSRVR